MEVFKKQLDELDGILKKIKAQQFQQTKLTSQMEKFNTSISKAKRSAEALLNTFRRIFSVIKSIGFASMLGSVGFGAKGVMAQKEVAKATSLDLDTQQLKALKYAGGQSQVANRDFLVNLATSLKQSLYTTDKAQHWASLGIDTESAKQMDTIELLKTFLSSVKEREGGDVGQNKNLQDILQGLSDINLGDLKNINTEEIWSNYERGLELTDRSAEKLQDIGKGVNTIITTFDTLIDKILGSLAPAFKTLLDSISNGIVKLYKSEDFQKMLDKVSNFMSGMSGEASDYIANLTKSIPDLLRDMKITFLSILSSLASVAKVFTVGMNDSVNKFKENIEKRLAQAQNEKLEDLQSRMAKTKDKKEYASLAEEIVNLTSDNENIARDKKAKALEQIQDKNNQMGGKALEASQLQQVNQQKEEATKEEKGFFERGWDKITSFFSSKDEKEKASKEYEEVKNLSSQKSESVRNYENGKKEEERKSQEAKKPQQGTNSQMLQPINITIHNDGDLNTQTHNLTSAINAGGWQWQ